MTTVLAIAGMALVTYGTRAGGLAIMARVPIGPRVERFLAALSGSVLVALVVPASLKGGVALQLAVAAALATMVLTKRSFLALMAAMAAAALWRTL